MPAQQHHVGTVSSAMPAGTLLLRLTIILSLLSLSAALTSPAPAPSPDTLPKNEEPYRTPDPPQVSGPPGGPPGGPSGGSGVPGGPSGGPNGPPNGVKVPGFVIVPPQLNPNVGDRGWLSLQGEALGQLLTAQGSPLIVTRTNFIVAAAGYEALAACTKNNALLFGTRFKKGICGNPDDLKTVVYVSIYRTLTTLFGTDLLLTYPGILRGAGINADDQSTDTTTLVGLGNAIGLALAQHFFHDGANQLGDEGGSEYNRIPFSDYTGYKPVNTAYELKDPTKWQPLRRIAGDGVQTYIQEFVGVHLAYMKTYTVGSTYACQARQPYKSKNACGREYKNQALAVLNMSASLDDTTKMLAEFFDFGANYAQIITHLSNKYSWTLTQQIKWHFALNLAGYDALNTVIYWKRRYDTVRPISVIRHSRVIPSKVKAWGGPGKGRVEMRSHEWRPYLRETAADPEFPSGTTAGVATLAEISRWFTGTDELGWYPFIPPKSSWVEVGVTPERPVTLRFPTFTSFTEQAKLARQYGGVHFADASEEGVTVAKCVCRAAIIRLQTLFDGLS